MILEFQSQIGLWNWIFEYWNEIELDLNKIWFEEEEITWNFEKWNFWKYDAILSYMMNEFE